MLDVIYIMQVLRINFVMLLDYVLGEKKGNLFDFLKIFYIMFFNDYLFNWFFYGLIDFRNYYFMIGFYMKDMKNINWR